MTAVDDAEPGRMATADVTILVQRNANAPKFSETQYRVTVSDRATLGEPITTVQAEDEDGVNCLVYLFIFFYTFTSHTVTGKLNCRSKLGPLARQYARKPKVSSLREFFNRYGMYGSLRFKGIVSDLYRYIALAITCIGFGIKIPTNLGFRTPIPFLL